MAAEPGGWLGPALGLRLLLATALQMVSGGRLRGSPGAHREGRAEEDAASGPAWEPHLERGEDRASSATAAARMRRGLIPALILPAPGFQRLFLLTLDCLARNL